MRRFGVLLVAITSLLVVASRQATSVEPMDQRIIKLYPEVDADADNRISGEEKRRLTEAILKRFPSFDRDNDGTLSENEMKQVLRRAEAAKASGKLPSLDFSVTNAAPSSDAVDSSTEPSVRQGPVVLSAGDNGVGRRIPDLTFTDLSGKEHRLSDYREDHAIVIAMTGTGCPLCLKYAPSLAKLEQQYANRGVQFVFVNPNGSESREKISQAISSLGFRGPYVRDADMAIPRALDAKTTTEVFVLDRARTLVYRGAVDDQYGFAYSREQPRQSFLASALDSLLKADRISIRATSAPGCDLYYADKQVPEPSRVKVTYHNQISRIIQDRCLECHRDGGIGPMSLAKYDEVRDYAAMIGSVVERGVMPPWFASKQSTENGDDPTKVHWMNDRSLSVDEKRTLADWIANGAIEGNPEDAPVDKVFKEGWLIGEPDDIFRFPNPVNVKATGTMPYQYVTVETNLAEDRWVQAIEVRPGQREVVHHVIVSVRSDDGEFDERDGYWGAYVPGTSTLVYPDGYARRLPKGARLRFQMHYTPNGTAVKDLTEIGLRYCDHPPKHEVKVASIANSKFQIPPGHSNFRVDAQLSIPVEAEVLSFLPHMHLRGKSARYELIRSGTEKILLHIPRYDFNWQLLYRLADPLQVHPGDKIRFTGWFDNSRDNPANPDATATVKWGPQTDDEMHLGYIEYIVPGVDPGDATPGMSRSRGRRSRQGSNSSGENANTADIIGAIKDLDRNENGKLELAEVPEQHHRLFHFLDSNDDNELTEREARESLRQRRQ